MLAAKVDVAVCVDSLEADVAQGVDRVGAEEIIVPLFGEGVDEDGVGGEAIVKPDNVGQVRGGFAAAPCRRLEEVLSRRLFGGKHKGDTVTARRRT